MLREINLRPHCFINAGNLLSLNHVGNWNARAREAIDTVRVSAGAGLVLPTPFGRLEINLTKPLRAQASDELKMFQIGIGLDFL